MMSTSRSVLPVHHISERGEGGEGGREERGGEKGDGERGLYLLRRTLVYRHQR